ncbi:MAG: ADP-ribosylglycohydrolase family protein [Thermodesulfobacteriota bacterium]|nr:ADP-ribosylglycohydrolase family protein [Thermodesulfobacteriota bacterium]
MMLSLAESLVENRGFNGQDMAQRFANNFNADRGGYGSGTIQALFIE